MLVRVCFSAPTLWELLKKAAVRRDQGGTDGGATLATPLTSLQKVTADLIPQVSIQGIEGIVDTASNNEAECEIAPSPAKIKQYLASHSVPRRSAAG